MSFTVDGIEWPVKCKVVRTVELKESEVSGLMMDLTYRNVCIGKWLRYDLAIVCPFGMEREYNQLHDLLTQPVDGHVFVLPYGAGTVTITARVQNPRDTLYENEQGNYWAGLELTVVANHPTSVMTLEESITRGFAPLPDIGGVQVGDIYEYTADGWEEYEPPSYINGDEVYF